MKNHKKTASLIWEQGQVRGFVGKNLIALKNGSLKMVKVLPFAVYPTHKHPSKTEFIFVLEGRPKITIGESVCDGEKNDFFTLPKNLKHCIENPTDTECILLVGAIVE